MSFDSSNDHLMIDFIVYTVGLLFIGYMLRCLVDLLIEEYRNFKRDYKKCDFPKK